MAIVVAVDVHVRQGNDQDRPKVLALLQLAMGEEPDPLNDALFTWKHRDNPFGPSPMWVACDGQRIVGLRVFMRWAWERDGQVLASVRAVDTATHPDYQGRGLFTRLTLGALDDLAAEGVAFVFNTPNDKSRPGYLKMGWREVGRLPGWVMVAKPTAPVKMLRARVPAAKWSEPCAGGAPANEVLADRTGLERLLATQPTRPGVLRTHRTPEVLAWRYGFAPLQYRAITGPGGVADGLVVWRNRRRGPAVEAAIDEVIAPGGDPAAVARLARRAVRASGADYGVVLGRRRGRTWLPLPGGGPILTHRTTGEGSTPSLAEWEVSLGDIELF